jgi:hypothetical protein
MAHGLYSELVEIEKGKRFLAGAGPSTFDFALV